ncbi:RNA polymerase ii subunit b1 ctd phosphatase rpap2 [Plakobranchus ocellatus]|uniref:RNA polymerase ii subunit b1 ctd phosphatase rpap2 n=1 Tax=Plakobranchus ocellatus TaxID=259542 RepID=A0AAV4CXC9_9GAST|nr:RNA polymerase ii subunit b1 ctd phosphatase rpap2 [Plakobranchus ocellatus]
MFCSSRAPTDQYLTLVSVANGLLIAPAWGGVERTKRSQVSRRGPWLALVQIKPLQLSIQDVSGPVREFIYTCRLEKDNIVLKPGEWTLAALFILKM